ncbi:MAG: hypothetical protein R3320_07975 [Nitriliruptorales bacterium]|nr:hypothetical protein [Nitriliruptorales bacterium]
MNRPLAPVPAAVLAVCVAFVVATPVLAAATHDLREEAPSGAVVNLVAAFLLTWAVVGALTASRHPKNPVGWLFLTAGVLFTAGPFADTYTGAVTAGGATLPLREYAGWVSQMFLNSAAVFGMFALILLLFPTGQAPSAKWRLLTVTLAVGTGAFTLLLALRPGPLTEVEPPTPNPLGLAFVDPVWDLVEAPLFFLFLAGCLAGVVSIALRFRRSAGTERQQLKWLFAGAGGLVAVTLTGPTLFWQVDTLEPYWAYVFIPALSFLPLTAGFAMLRYRLYDIDRIVSRTASYAILALMLGAVYVGTTLLASTALRPVTGEGDLPVAAATLMAAAAFRPLHGRVRGAVDRRFNRRRYDANRAVEGFGQSLRDELDSAGVADAVKTIARTTFEPETVGGWLARS